jgi:hypothetical protein
MMDLGGNDLVQPVFITNAVQHDWLRHEGWPYVYTANDFSLNPHQEKSVPGLCSFLVRQIVDFVRPVTVVTDVCFPEALPAQCETLGIPFICLFDSDWCQELHGAEVQNVLEHGGLIIITNYLERHYGSKFVYAGPFILQRNGLLEQRLANRYWKRGGFRVLCMQGGGGWTRANSTYEQTQRPFIVSIDRLLGSLGRDDVDALFFTGPYQEEMATEHLKIEGFEPDVAYLFASADLALIRGGTQQVTETLSMSCPTIVYPANYEKDDQKQNLNIWGGHRGITCWEGDPVDSANLVRSLLDHDRLSQLRQSIQSMPKPDGEKYAAEMILSRLIRR